MRTKWVNPDFDFEYLVLAGDIGGTNTNLALMGVAGDKVEIVFYSHTDTSKVTNLSQCIDDTISKACEKAGRFMPRMCCISAAGPVVDNFCHPTNIAWTIDGDALAKHLNIPTVIINDFMAISYSLPLLDVNNTEQILALPGTDGFINKPYKGTRAVVGAGTGLGVGFLLEEHGRYMACPSEGGHMAFSPFDEESGRLLEYVAGKSSYQPGFELFVSGRGITNIFEFYRDVQGIKLEGVLANIDSADPSDKPEMISKNADSDPLCREIIRLFVKCYARAASNVSACVLPSAGMFLAGGIVTHNEKYFLEENLFMRYFEPSYNANINRVLKQIPVYIIRDYSISLYGAANAAVMLLGQ